MGYEYGYDSSDPCPPGAGQVYEDPEDYELHKYTKRMMSKPRGKGMMKNSRGHGSESEPEIISKEELEEIEKLNKSVNEDVFKALEARDQFT